MTFAKRMIYFNLFFIMSICAVGYTGDYPIDAVLNAPDGTTVTIFRDSYGVPHIVGESEVGVFFGQGYAAGRDRLYQMEYLRRASEGKMAEVFGPGYTLFDKAIRRMYYTEKERSQHFQNFPKDLQIMLEAYRDGVNTYLDSMRINPEKFKPLQFAAYQMENWTVNKSIAIMQYMIRNFGQFGGEELTRLSELQNHGQEWFDQYRPINDPQAPTTIPSDLPLKSSTYHYAGMTVGEEVISSIIAQQEDIEKLAQDLKLPLKFGSFAVQISGKKSNSGNVMLLGCPQMGEPVLSEPQICNEVELQCPTLHVGGMTIAGLPSVIIGHNEYHAWTLTSGYSDNSDVFIDSTFDNSYSKYYHNGEWLDFEVIQDTIYNGESGVPYTHYRTIHGPVFADNLANSQVFSMEMSFWNHELDMIQFIFGLIKAKNLEEFETAVALNPMSFNLFYAGSDQQIKYWHTGRYQDRSDGVDPRLPHKGDGSEEWGGIIDFAELPTAINPPSGYFVNWNNKPVKWWDNGDNIPWVGSHPVSNIDNYVGPINGFNFNNLTDVPKQINSHGTYQQAVEFSEAEIIDQNILPPGQSGFINLSGVASVHSSDQWSMHLNWQFKDMEYGQSPQTGIHRKQADLTRFFLDQNYPNPFNPSTQINFTLPKQEKVKIEIYNSLGQCIRTLLDEEKNAGAHHVIFSTTNLSSGIYFYRIQAGKFEDAKKMILLR